MHLQRRRRHRERALGARRRPRRDLAHDADSARRSRTSATPRARRSRAPTSSSTAPAASKRSRAGRSAGRLPLSRLTYWVRGAAGSRRRARRRSSATSDAPDRAHAGRLARRARELSAGASTAGCRAASTSKSGAQEIRLRRSTPGANSKLRDERDATGESFPRPRKLNLMLRVVGRRADGYHLLQTVFRFIDYGDDVRVARARRRRHRARRNDVPGVPPEDDLTLRAARLLQRATGTRLGADIDAREAPAARRRAGRRQLGCGDGAARAQSPVGNRAYAGARCRRWRSNWAPMCRSSCSARTRLREGIGERLTRSRWPPAWYLVLTPAGGGADRADFRRYRIETRLKTD